MKTPPMLIGFALIFWGWQSGMLVPAICSGFLMEGARFMPWRWNLSTKDFQKVWTVCGLFFIGTAIVLAASRQSEGVFILASWLPIIFLPMLVSQIYSTQDRIQIRTFFLLMRKKITGQTSEKAPTIDLTYPYFALCVIAGSAANIRTFWFYAALCVLCSWALYAIRPQRYSILSWVIILVIALSAGYGSSVLLNKLQHSVEDKFINLYTYLFQNVRDPFKINTAIGELRSLKTSPRILYQVENSNGSDDPILLPTATYTIHKQASWYATKATFSEVVHGLKETTWPLLDAAATERTITVSAFFKRGRGLLAIPNNAYLINDLPVIEMKRNRLGSIRINGGPRFAEYKVKIAASFSLNGPPDKTDLLIPDLMNHSVSIIAQELNLSSKSPKEILQSVRNFFLRNFTYSLDLTSGKSGIPPLEDFLLHTRSGHCEYFATSTALLLRKAGISCRYVVGYAAHEYNGMNKKMVVRQRDAHSWILVYMNNNWQNFDTTPPDWSEMERGQASQFEYIKELWANLVYLFTAWRWGEAKLGLPGYLWLAVLPLLIYLTRKASMRFKKVRRQGDKRKTHAPKAIQQGNDSAYYMIEEQLQKKSGTLRHPWETLFSWINRMEKQGVNLLHLDQLKQIVSLHYRYRFDPAGLTHEELNVFKGLVENWLSKYTHSQIE